MRLQRIEIEGLGELQHFLLEPGTLTVLFDANETGKTTVVDALVRVLFRGPRKVFPGAERKSGQLPRAERVCHLPHHAQVLLSGLCHGKRGRRDGDHDTPDQHVRRAVLLSSEQQRHPSSE